MLVKRTDIPIYFGRVLGLGKPSAKAVATAVGPTPIQTLTRGLWPVGVQYPTAQTFGQTMTLSEKGAGNSVPGNWAWLNFPQCSPIGSAPPASYHGGGVPNLVQNITNGSTCGFSIGDTVTPETGAKGNSTQTANTINSLIGSGNPPPSDPSKIVLGDSQLVIVPLVDWNSAHGQSTAVPILGFAAVWLTSLTGQGAAITLYGQFVKVVDQYAQGGSGTNWGAYGAPFLVQ